MIHFLTHALGLDNLSGPFYGFWSGFGSDLGEATIVVGLFAWWKSGECHVEHCHRRGKHPFKHYKLCSKHHPSVPQHVTHLHIKELHREMKHG